mmetsp:Transcript_17033/g.23831  ORF Transcript_17033/g.23831 Transcript_17033/m.23831 type:complete len:260 (-) Transcript_17033:90-869(-)
MQKNGKREARQPRQEYYVTYDVSEIIPRLQENGKSGQECTRLLSSMRKIIDPDGLGGCSKEFLLSHQFEQDGIVFEFYDDDVDEIDEISSELLANTNKEDLKGRRKLHPRIDDTKPWMEKFPLPPKIQRRLPFTDKERLEGLTNDIKKLMRKSTKRKSSSSGGRLAIACDHCRQKKICCDTNETCSECEKRGIECVRKTVKRRLHVMETNILGNNKAQPQHCYRNPNCIREYNHSGWCKIPKPKRKGRRGRKKRNRCTS